ncbi:mandelate racemase/muconate lactonizing enzyme family protein [Bradyrhizobium sp. F1.13.3]|uniref:mandelate racemase/muconate lactonizing enzyme family protein n=1 Tax=Bradyrhizobium sp. F1.13.3 TaxID=3156351 RepID=UPI003393D042
MKIIGIETVRLRSRTTVIWVRVHTDDGLVGLGETWFGCAAVEADIHERIAPALLGRDSSVIETLNRQMRPYVGFAGTSAEMRALSAVDIALWDLAGKRARQPLYALFGGAARDRIPDYNTCAGPEYLAASSDVRPQNFGLTDASERTSHVFDDLNGFMKRPEAVAAELLEMGISAMKIWPFDFAEGASDGLDISTADLKIALAPFARIRKEHREAMRIKAELHGLWSPAAARKICAALDDYEVDWIEDPIWMDQLDHLPAIASATRAPVAAGETLGGAGQFRELMQRGVSVPIIDPSWGGGITVARKVASLAEATARPIAFHDCSGPVTLAACAHLAIACPNVREQEIARGFYFGWYRDYVDAPTTLENGFLLPSAGPGLGLELVADLFKGDDAIVRTSNAAPMLAKLVDDRVDHGSG